MEKERNMKWELNDDGGSFDRILREAEEAANVDESFKMSSLVRMIVQRHIVKQVAPKEFGNLGCFDQTYVRADEDDEQEIRKPKTWRRRGSGRMHIC
ncbi:hypothetical protein WN944_029501 [Citrus x changshan-huyou]|uniref:Uncharacterized protein n=1 Tax=Citrus x changshan-huyou TaxID=2935761 RepID=A0AAP0LSN1_9ROSI